MIRRDFMRSALTLGAASGTGLALGTAPPAAAKRPRSQSIGPAWSAGMDGGSL